MTAAPLASTIIAIGLIPVAFLFCHAFLSGRGKNRFHPVTGVLAISWDLIMSIGYMLYRSFGGAVEGASLQLTPTLDVYFGVHVKKRYYPIIFFILNICYSYGELPIVHLTSMNVLKERVQKPTLFSLTI